MNILSLTKRFLWLLVLNSGVVNADTIVEQEDFRLELPGDWFLTAQHPEEGLWVYGVESGSESISVSVLYFSAEPAPTQMREFLEQYVDTRREATREISGSSYGEKPSMTEHVHGWSSTFFEVDKKSGRRAANRAISSKVGILNVYYEAYLRKEVFLKRSASILSSVAFSG